MRLDQEGLTAEELRELLEYSDFPFDDATVARLLPLVQPMRARLRAADLRQRGVMLRGAMLSAEAKLGPEGSPARRSPSAGRTSTLRPESEEEDRPASLVKRLGVLVAAVYTAGFALIFTQSESPALPIAMGVLALVFGYAAVTGKGLAAAPRRPGKAGTAKWVAGGILVFFVGGPIVSAAFAMLFTPAGWREGGVIENVLRVFGLLLIVIVLSHLGKALRRKA